MALNRVLLKEAGEKGDRHCEEKSCILQGLDGAAGGRLDGRPIIASVRYASLNALSTFKNMSEKPALYSAAKNFVW